MSSSKERVFVVGATGHIGCDVIRQLIKKEIETTAYVRNEEKAKILFKDELNTDLLTVIIGTYSSVDIYTKAIQGHTRLFLLIADLFDKPTSMSEIKEIFGKIAYEQGVRQIVNLSADCVRISGRQGMLGYTHTTAEEKLWKLAEENPEQRSIVMLRPVAFMSNHLISDVHHVKNSNKLVSCGLSSSKMTWIDTEDISDCAVVILTDSVEKHDRNVYEMGAETLSNEQRAAIFSKVLGQSITYEQQSVENFYKAYTDLGIPHSFSYDLVSYYMNDRSKINTPQLSILINRPLHTLEEWIIKNIDAFQNIQ